MKVISIKQPWASLIVNGYKEYEFRSWNTKFRGKVLIHASQNVDKEMINKFKDLNLDYPTGCIIGSVNIVDCIKLDNNLEKELIKNDELVYGLIKDLGGYAFKLKNIEKYANLIETKGQLGFWNYEEK